MVEAVYFPGCWECDGQRAGGGNGGMNIELFEQGLELMLAGMGTVFVFLTLLVFATTAMSALVQRFQPAPALEPDGVSEEEVAAISAAIARHRSKQSSQ